VVVAVLEVELVLAALFRGGRGEKATRLGVAEDGGAELLGDEGAGLCLRPAVGDGREEALVDDRLRRRDPIRLLGRELPLPAEDPRLESPPAVERQNVEGSVEPEVRHATSLRRPRWRRMSAFVELS